jgi:steroid delta-isomerase-like uncharacterized protein
MGEIQDRNRNTVMRNYEEVWNDGRLEVAEETVSANFADHPPTRFFDVGLVGPASLQDAASHFRDACPDFHDTMEYILAEDDRVAYLGTIRGTQTAEMFGFPATGKEMSVRGVNFFRMEDDGKIAERWGQFDVLSMMMQLGLAPSPMGPPPFPDVKPGPLKPTGTGDPKANAALYQRLVDEVVNLGHFDVVDEIFDPGYVDHGAPPGAPPGLDGVKMVFGMFRNGFSDVKFTIDQTVAEGDMVATLVHGEGTHDGDFMGTPPSGNHALWRSVGFFRVANGKIVEHWGIPDLLGLLIQIGVIPPPPAISARPHA